MAWTPTGAVPVGRYLAIACATLILWTGCKPADPGAAASGEPGTITLSIVGTSDLHGGLLPRSGRGGVALLAGFVSNLRAARARDGGAVLLIDAGDLFQGTLESNLAEGEPVIAAYNALSYTAAAVGNHEFDYGPVGPAATPRSRGDDPRGALKARALEAHFPFLAANLVDTATAGPVAWANVRPSVVTSAGGILVGIIGVTTAEALRVTIAANTHGLAIAPLASTVAAEASRLRTAGATVVIVAAHAGGRCTQFSDAADLSSCEPSSEIFQLAQQLPAGLVDAIVAGHTHSGIAHEVAGIAITQAYNGGRAFGRIDLTVDRASGRVVSHHLFAPHDLCARENPETHGCWAASDTGMAVVPASYEGQPVVADASLAALLAPAVARVSELKARPLGVMLQTPVRRAAGPGDSPLGNLFTDVLLETVPGADLSLYNTAGGLRADLPQGPLTYGGLYEALPFDNLLVTVHLTGAELRRVFETRLAQSQTLVGVSGISVEARCESGGLAVTLRRTSGAPIADTEKLAVVTMDYLLLGGEGLLTPVTPPGGFAIPDDAPVAREAIADRLRRRGGSIREAQLVDAAHPRWTYPGALPVACP